MGMRLTVRALKALPVGSFVRFTKTHDMDGNLRDAVVWRSLNTHNQWTGRDMIEVPSVSNQYFDTHTGEYLGERVQGEGV